MCFERLVQEPDQHRRAREEIGKRVLVECAEERALRVLECPFESAGAVDRAGIPGCVEALDEVPAWFGTPNQAAHIDLGWRFVQSQAALPPADTGNQVLFDQQLHDFDQDVRRDSVGAADLADRNQSIFMQAQVDQEAQRVIREFCERQRVPRLASLS